MTFGEKLYSLRRERNWSQESLAQKLGVSRQAISRWELGEVVPDTANVLAVSRLFGVSADYLLREECLSQEDAATSSGLSLKDRQEAVGKGMLYRFCALSGPAVWYLNAGERDRLLLFFTLGWTLIFGLLLGRTAAKLRRLDTTTANKLLRNDALCTCCICFFPLLLRGLPERLELLLAELAMVPVLQKTWMELRRVYGLPLKKR